MYSTGARRTRGPRERRGVDRPSAGRECRASLRTKPEQQGSGDFSLATEALGAIVASYAPARRAARVNPIEVLRERG